MRCATPITVPSPESEVIVFTYDADGRLTRVRPAGAEPDPGPAPDGDARLLGPFVYTGFGSVPEGTELLAPTRDYDPGVGTWTAQDPTGFRGGDSNLYRYAAPGPE
jgi:RHS repeat-associated protein